MITWNMEPQVELSRLEDNISKETIKWAVCDLGADKVPGPDRFPLFFYRTFWRIDKGDILELVRGFMEGKARSDRINYSQAALIPKTKHQLW